MIINRLKITGIFTLFQGAFLMPSIQVSAQNIYSNEISIQNNDIEVAANNTVDFTSSTIALHGKAGSRIQETYFRFENINLPSDAIINNVYIIFCGGVASNTSSTMQISGEVGSSNLYPTSTSAATGTQIKSRLYTGGTITWNTNGCVINQEYSTPNLAMLVSEMFPNGFQSANMAFRIRGNEQGNFTVKSFSAASGLRPKLVINYWSAEGESITTFVSNLDDAKESNTGAINTTYAYHNLGGRTDGNLSAIRFQNVNIPDSAQITDAYIEFYAYGASPAGSIKINSEMGNANIYNTTSSNISNRDYSIQEIVWNVNNWVGLSLQRTPNLKSIIDENRLTGWGNGQNLAFKFTGTATNRPATAYSFDGAVNYRPRLVITYLNNNAGPSIDGAITNPALMTKLYINEVSSQGTSAQSEDWIELYNDHDQPVYIDGGVYLSDKNNNRTLSELKKIIIPAKGFITVLATSTPDLGKLHMNFGLSASGETVYLSSLDNNVVVEQDRFVFGKIPFNQTVGRFPNGANTIIPFIQPSYNASNQEGKQLITVVANQDRGVYEQGFNLELTAAQGVTIRYTLDGKYPSSTIGTLYTAPIVISKSTVVKYFAYDNAGNHSGVVALTYVLKNNYANESSTAGYGQWIYKNNITAAEYAQAMSQIPIVSVSSGIEHNTNWAAASIEYLDNHIYPNRNNFFSNSMTKKFGQESVGFYNPNIKFKFNSDAGVKKADYPFFDPYPGDLYPTPEKTQTLELKQGQDNASRNVYNLGFMRWSEKITMNIQKEMDKYALDTRYVQLFINGKYRGLKTLRNDYKTNNVEEVFGDDSDHYTKVNLQDGYFTGGIVESGDGLQSVWNNVRSVANSKNLQGLKNLVDIDDLIKFQIMFMFTDTENEATAIMHNTDPNVMKAKFMINDTDGAFFGGNVISTSNTIMNPTAFAGGGGNYKYKWLLSSSRNGPAGIFGQFMGATNNITTGNLEFKTLVKDAVLKYMGPANGTFQGAEGAPLSVAKVQQKMHENIAELDILYKVDAAYMGFSNNAYQLWKNVDYPRIVAQTPERVSFSIQKWLEYNMAHTLDFVRVVNNNNEIVSTDSIILFNPNVNTTVYYTTNGTDPMGNDGVISAQALPYSGAFQLPVGNYNMVTRAYTAHNWGPISRKAIQVVNGATGKLVITGIHYKPQNNGDAEFILLSNSGHADLDVSGYNVNDAIKFTFPQNFTILQGETIMLAKNLSLIEGFNSLRKIQWTSGSLSNDGEPITFKDANGNTVDFVSYLSNHPWSPLANGQGYYLHLIHDSLNNELPESWVGLSLTVVNINQKLNLLKANNAIHDIKLYPNPVNHQLNIEVKEISTLEIFTINGQLVMQGNLQLGNNSIDLSHLAAGNYIVNIKNKTVPSKSYKIIKH
jgi:hypothetical protein